ncbi:hypothetical protein EMMF5_006624, partial [Cystobasidiomycetes sp. EMM_F5]
MTDKAALEMLGNKVLPHRIIELTPVKTSSNPTLGILPTILVVVRDQPLRILLDTGAAISVISKALLEKLDPNYHTSLSGAKAIANAFGSRLQSLGTYITP